MIAKVAHISLNARGGAERLAVITINTLHSMGFDVELATMERPDMASIKQTYGLSNAGLDVSKVSILDVFNNKDETSAYDLTINTHGDILPFFRKDFSKGNSIVYCHYPIARDLIELRDPTYSEMLQSMARHSSKGDIVVDISAKARKAYSEMLEHSTVLTNSEFSRRAILDEFGIDSTLLYPPVDVDVFRTAALLSDERDDDDCILVISRFHPSKKLENAIGLAELLKENNVGKCMKIAGNMSPADSQYFSYLNKLVRQRHLQDFVKFELNVSFDRLLQLMRQAKVYFHPMPGEPFGISTVEAISAGLIPVVYATGGHTEFVPVKYQFYNLAQAVEAVAAALDAPESERMQLSNSTQKYSTENYAKKLEQIIIEVLSLNKQQPSQTAPIILASKEARH